MTSPDLPMRSDYSGALRDTDVGRTVAVCGWVHRRREHGEHLAFIDVRDHTGLVQCVVDGAHDLRSEYVVRVVGTVRLRPEGTENTSLATGAIEVGDCTVEILNTRRAAAVPSRRARRRRTRSRGSRHRYVDLRTERMQRNLRVRAKINSALRASMERQGFVEIETPMLIASTPEGARDFVVPSRLSPGEFYALPQSPQLFKQMCMVGGFDRYFQIARCLRDEDLRADRQFEFMQLDMEAAFVGQEEVLAFISEAVADATEAVRGERPPEFERMTWLEAHERFGSDKPDIRFAMELVELTPVFAETEFNAFRSPDDMGPQGFAVKGIVVPDGASLPRRRLDEMTEQAKHWGAKGLVWMKVDDDLTFTSPVTKFLSEAELQAIVTTTGATAGDLVLIVADRRPTVWHVLGLLRLELGRPPLSEGGLRYLWVTEFPLFEAVGDDGSPIPVHHPFTMPQPDDIGLLESGDPAELLRVRSQSYDLVVNGWELGSGSVRIHDGELQTTIFGLVGIDAQ